MEKLPTPTKKKKIDIKKFISLAKRVKKTFEEEEEYLKKHENTPSSRFSLNN